MFHIISSFPSTEQHLSESKDWLFLVFENVRDPELVLSLLPPDKHCVIMTSSTDQPWRKLNLVPSRVFSVQIGPLDAESSFLLFEQILTRNRHRNLFNKLCMEADRKENLRAFLSECLLSLLLAIRSFAFQLCEEEDVACDFLLLINRSLSPHRTRSDERAAGRVHIRGFFHVVRYALHCLSSEEPALELCFLLSLLPSCQTPIWFATAVAENLGICPSHVKSSLKLLSDLGLITANCEFSDMHRLIQNHVRAHFTEHQTAVINSVIRATIQTFEDEVFAAFEILERFSKPNFGSIRRFRTMTGLEIEN